jgi:alpha-1,6-mannosyltransferase
MLFASAPVTGVLALAGSAYLVVILLLVVTRAPLGSALFFTAVFVMQVAYTMMLARVWKPPKASRALLFSAFALALAFRAPLALAPVGADNDMIRYLWDGRVQRLGYNPYLVLPSDPAMSHTHTEETARMPSLGTRTPYPPAAQLFFRLVVGLKDSALAMKLALVACDILTALVLWRWLAATGRNEWLTLAYAWNPLVILEVAHSGHMDTLGALWIVTSAYWLSRNRTMLSAVAFVLAVASKLLPIVLLPLYWRRLRPRDAVFAGILLAALYFRFAHDGSLTFGSVPNVVAHIRFNGPVFAAIAALTTAQTAAAVAIGVGLLAAAIARWRLTATDPEAWAWPMALSLAAAPVVYPWYLLYLSPFLLVRATLPLTVWSFTSFLTYVVWYQARNGGRWIVPGWAMTLEYTLVLAAVVALVLNSRAWLKRPEGSAPLAAP